MAKEAPAQSQESIPTSPQDNFKHRFEGHKLIIEIDTRCAGEPPKSNPDGKNMLIATSSGYTRIATPTGGTVSLSVNCIKPKPVPAGK